ncbi:MAG: hypothetical protein HQ582_13115 [Planctomycetes bacterium]|nr:hypothetical protein [Planctomycetota bacterium]
MANTIAILDDEPDRIDAMAPLLRRHFPNQEVKTFDNAPDMIEWLREHLDRCVLLCLDHDLGPNRTRDGATFDPGIGRDVVDYLATRDPVCPVIIHTTNALAAPGMEAALGDAGWACARVVPYGDTEWIAEWWIEEVRNTLT